MESPFCSHHFFDEALYRAGNLSGFLPSIHGDGVNAESFSEFAVAQLQLGLGTGDKVVHVPLLHNAITMSSPFCCNSVEAQDLESRQNVAMPKKRKKPKKRDNYLFEWREFRGLTQEALAAAVKPPTNASVISLLENGDRGLSNKWLERLKVPLRTRKGYLLDVNPYEASTSILEIWNDVPEDERARVRNILEQFTKKTGTNG